MTHKQSKRFNESNATHGLEHVREDQIKRLLQDIGFLPNRGGLQAQDTSHDQT